VTHITSSLFYCTLFCCFRNFLKPPRSHFLFFLFSSNSNDFYYLGFRNVLIALLKSWTSSVPNFDQCFFRNMKNDLQFFFIQARFPWNPAIMLFIKSWVFSVVRRLYKGFDLLRVLKKFFNEHAAFSEERMFLLRSSEERYNAIFGYHTCRDNA